MQPRAYHLLVLIVACLLAGCRTPEPRKPDAVRQHAEEPAEPSIFDRLPMGRRQERRVRSEITQVRQAFGPYESQRHILFAEIAREVRVGALTHEVLDPLIERTIVEYEAALPALIHFFDVVHSLLSPRQRRRLVELWDEQDEGGDEAQQRKREEESFTRVLDLTSGQKTRLIPPLLGVYLRYAGAIGDLKSAVKEAKEAFVQDEFQAELLPLFSSLQLRELAAALFEAAVIGLRVLEPSQRETLAAIIETRW